MFKDYAPKGSKRAVQRARARRREMSLPEGLLWRELRKRPAGLKFRHEHATGAFSLDFYCSDARLAIEVDGEAHGFGERPARDTQRDAWLAECGIATLRIPVAEVLRDLDAVLRGVVAEARSRLPLHHPAAPGGPPPRGKLGEE
ncbi:MULTISPECIES: endonuclease domain-containing protein [unclassified Sphingomonas]|uniref:endonuclease domain-containing protein n=1 Tax=unclassified Sphingomonas TaxID=196159 RepID=UPI0022B2DCEA|nr:endonuclease domain-containing protein [Sphingomonas sp. NIBR02145]WHU04068.1 endonuclease domain-containing protein [Sphingomonas sp. NIBR02145]